jgi:hypothetical protein
LTGDAVKLGLVALNAGSRSGLGFIAAKFLQSAPLGNAVIWLAVSPGLAKQPIENNGGLSLHQHVKYPMNAFLSRDALAEVIVQRILMPVQVIAQPVEKFGGSRSAGTLGNVRVALFPRTQMPVLGPLAVISASDSFVTAFLCFGSHGEPPGSTRGRVRKPCAPLGSAVVLNVASSRVSNAMYRSH